MILRQWDELPENIRNGAVRPYYEYLQRKRGSLLCKFIFDRVVSLIMLICLSPVFLVLAYMIKQDSPGPVFFRQVRVTRYGQVFCIYKFRTMVNNAEQLGTQVTTKSDMRITNIGKKLRGCRLDELPQLINILKGEMTFVGTRPEVVKYVKQYTPEMMATLLLPAGVTSEASIKYKDEEKLLANAINTDSIYINEILLKKMEWNLLGIKNFSVYKDFQTMIKTIKAIV